MVELRAIRRNAAYWPVQEINKRLEHIEGELERHAKDLDYLGKTWGYE